MTAEELAEIRKRISFRTLVDDAEWLDSPCMGLTAHEDSAALLTHTDAQAQRIAELEAQLAARGRGGPDEYICGTCGAQWFDGIQQDCGNRKNELAYFKSSPCKAVRLEHGALATAQAVTLTEEERLYLTTMDAHPTDFAATLKYDVMNLRRIIYRLTGASTPAQGAKL